MLFMRSCWIFLHIIYIYAHNFQNCSSSRAYFLSWFVRIKKVSTSSTYRMAWTVCLGYAAHSNARVRLYFARCTRFNFINNLVCGSQASSVPYRLTSTLTHTQTKRSTKWIADSLRSLTARQIICFICFFLVFRGWPEEVTIAATPNKRDVNQYGQSTH